MNEIIESYRQNLLGIFVFGSLFIIGGFYLSSKKGALDMVKTEAARQGIKPHITKKGINYHRSTGYVFIVIGIIWFLLPFIAYLKNYLF